VPSPVWNSDTVNSAGAVTWCNGKIGCHGVVSAANSLVGASVGDFVGNNGVFTLSNGNYVVSSASWSNGATASAGAVTLCQGDGSCTGPVSPNNSLVGSTANDNVGMGSLSFGTGVVTLPSGNFVVISPNWHQNALRAGAITWVDYNQPTGVVSAANSLTGTADLDLAETVVTALANGNYVVTSPYWDNGATADVGAATLCNGTTGCTGSISATNSLVGSTPSDRIGFNSATALTSGNYVVASPYWSNGSASQIGAVSLCDGQSGCVGSVSPLVLGTLTGIGTNDIVGNSGVSALANGAYVVGSNYWSNGSVWGAGAATWCNGTSGCAGQVSATNSLIGSLAGDEIADDAPEGVHPLTNGNYVVYSNHWTNNGTTVGAVTWGDGNSGLIGTVTSANSFIGVTTSDYLGGPRVFAVANGNYIISSPSWTDAGVTNAGAVSLLRGFGPQTGTITATNSVVGGVADGGQSMSFDYDTASDTLIVGRPSENIVTFLQVDQLFFNHFE